MKKLGKKNEFASETVEAFTCWCLTCRCTPICACTEQPLNMVQAKMSSATRDYESGNPFNLRTAGL